MLGHFFYYSSHKKSKRLNYLTWSLSLILYIQKGDGLSFIGFAQMKVVGWDVLI